MAEQIADLFEPGTEAALRAFQATHGLTAHGRVDEVTARGLGSGETPSAIAGIVCKPDGAPIGDAVVKLVQRAPGAPWPDRARTAASACVAGRDGRANRGPGGPDLGTPRAPRS